MEKRLRLGARQVEALQLWAFDPAHLEFYEAFPDEDGPPDSLALERNELVFDARDASAVFNYIVNAANSADDEAERLRGTADAAEFRADWAALTAIARRVLTR